MMVKKTKKIKPKIGKQISLDNNKSSKLGTVSLFLIISEIPLPNEVIINPCGMIPKKEPKNNFFF